MNSKIRIPAANNHIDDELARLRIAGAEVQRIKLNAQRELNIARRMRAEAERYLKETETNARSQAQMLILKARMETRKELAELKRVTTEEIQKLLVDIRMVRIMAQEELEVQRKITDAARIRNLSISSKKKFEEKMRNVAEAVVA